MGGYLRPRVLDEALTALGLAPRVVLAGGTDYYPARVGRAPDDDILDITGIDALRGIGRDGDFIRIGAGACWADLAAADLPRACDGLKAASAQIGGVQVQNAGTVVGNLCNASPAADGIPNLLALDALVELTSRGGIRRVAVHEFITGNRATTRRLDELATAILLPVPPAAARGCFLKLGARSSLVISIAMVAGVLVPAPDGTVAAARLAVGACSPVACRLPALEAALTGRRIGPDLADLVAPEQLSPLSPISDVRADAFYRLDAVPVLLRRVLRELAA